MILDGKVAVVTGGTRGIGFETVRQFLLNGAKVCLLGSRAETVDKAIQTLKSENQDFRVIGFYPNLTSESEVAKTFESVKEAYEFYNISHHIWDKIKKHKNCIFEYGGLQWQLI